MNVRANHIDAHVTVVALLVLACERGESVRGPTSDLPTVRATVMPIAGLSVAARVDVVAERAVEIEVHHGRDGSPRMPPRTVPVPSSGRLTTTIIGLDAGATSQIEVTARSKAGSTATTGALEVTTEPLPEPLTRLEVTVNRGVSGGYVLLSMNPHGLDGLATMVDRSGRVLWYRRNGGGAFTFDRLPSGNFIVHQIKPMHLEEVALDGTVIRTWNDRNSLTGADGHDFRMLPNGHALLFGNETHRVDSRRLLPGGVRDALRWDDNVSEVGPDGAVYWRWTSFSHVSEKEIIKYEEEELKGDDYEVVHTNSIDPLPDGNILLSFRNTSSVMKIDRATGNVIWRLGGNMSDFRFMGDPLGMFNRQHDARFVAPGRVLLFDNGAMHRTPESRAVEYVLDEAKMTATLAWQYRRSPPLVAKISGSARRLADGHTLISYGPHGVVAEVDAEATLVWELQARLCGVYRAVAIPAVYP